MEDPKHENKHNHIYRFPPILSSFPRCADITRYDPRLYTPHSTIAVESRYVSLEDPVNVLAKMLSTLRYT
jgi:hypothetical protein